MVKIETLEHGKVLKKALVKLKEETKEHPGGQKNYHLNLARKAKMDRFFTRRCTVEEECNHYVKHFKDKVIYCNCDIADSEFFLYFVENFEKFGLKKLIASALGYDYIDFFGKPSQYIEYFGKEKGFKITLFGKGKRPSIEHYIFAPTELKNAE